MGRSSFPRSWSSHQVQKGNRSIIENKISITPPFLGPSAGRGAGAGFQIFPPQIPQGFVFPSFLFFWDFLRDSPFLSPGAAAPVGRDPVVAPCGDRVGSPRGPQMSPEPRPHPSPVPRAGKRRKISRVHASPGAIFCPQCHLHGWDGAKPGLGPPSGWDPPQGGTPLTGRLLPKDPQGRSPPRPPEKPELGSSEGKWGRST